MGSRENSSLCDDCWDARSEVILNRRKLKDPIVEWPEDCKLPPRCDECEETHLLHRWKGMSRCSCGCECSNSSDALRPESGFCRACSSGCCGEY